ASLPRRGVCRRCPQRAVLVGLHLLRTAGSRRRPSSPRSLRVFPPLVLYFTTISYSSTSTKININHITSPGERRAVTPRKYKAIFFVRCNAAEAFLVLRE